MKYEGSHKRLDVTTYVVKMYDARVNILCDIVLSCGFTKVPERTWPARRAMRKIHGHYNVISSVDERGGAFKGLTDTLTLDH